MKKIFLLVLATFILISVGYATVFNSSKSLAKDKEAIVLMHGLGRSNAAMWLLAHRLEHAGYQVKRVGYSSLDQTPAEILKEISKQINACCQNHNKRVHFVGHSLGGLMVRAYLQNYKVKNLGNVVLLGTPNQGTKAADYFKEKWYMNLLGPTAKALGTDKDSFVKTLKPPYYPVGIIAGEYKSESNDEIIPGKDDGLVSVEATKLNGMTDFILIETGHSMMRYNSEVAEQTIEFIKHKKFKEKKLK